MKKFYLLALAALALAFSCQKNSEINDTTEVTPEPVMRTVTCTIADLDSKVALNATNGKTEWEVDDEILFHGKYAGGSYSAVVKLTAGDISADGKSFTATIPNFTNGANQAKWEEYGSKSNIFAAYPASAITGDNASTNWYYQNKFNATNLPLMSGFNDNYDSDHFIFYNLTGILSFVVNGDIDSYTLAGNNSEAVAYTNYASRIYKKTDDDIKTDWVYAGTPVATVSGTVTPGEETRICIPGGVTFSGGFTITFSYAGTPVKTLSTTKSVDVPRNSYRPMGNVTSYLKDYVAPATHDSSISVPDDNSDYDLSKTASANCYIVDGSVAGNANKEFKFKAYKGNSNTSVGSIASVEVLWETYNNAEDVTANSIIAAVDYDKQAANDYYEIVFKMPSTLHAGNAVIAAKNAGGTILWSWHIWVPETAISTHAYGNAFGITDAMDRNLGALVKATTDNVPVESYGLFYQWGRKDPFPGMGAVATNSAAKTSKALAEKSSTAISIQESIENPTKYAYTGGGDEGYDWCTTATSTLWDNSGKTIYDPCPPGYRVPVRNSSYSFWNSASISSWTIDSENHYFEIYSKDSLIDGDEDAIMPIAGYIDDGGGSYSKAGERPAYWGATQSSDSKGYCAYIKSGSYGSSAMKARGSSVRCVKE